MKELKNQFKEKINVQHAQFHQYFATTDGHKIKHLPYSINM